MMVIAALLVGCAEERELPDGGAPGARVHPAGILDPASDAFHGRELARRDWSFATCATCHGDDFKGGKAGVSCFGCHRDGPTGCTTCHADGPTTSAHAVHRVTGKLGCGECHTVPATWDAEGHILRGGKADPPPAEVTFGARAGAGATFADGTCTTVYCHGATLHAGGTMTAPRWESTAPAGACTGCHGEPPPSHAQAQCATCHPPSAPHVDGIVQVGRTAGCDGCHGDASTPAPPRDLAGNTATTALGVGAHRVHLNAAALRGPIACATCHQVPASVSSPGHIDTPLPAEVAPELGWDRGSGTCTTAWCHGAARPVWTASGQVTCGSCHGIPPASSSHAPGLQLTDCATCHPRSVTPQGSILFVNGATRHMDGAVDVD